MKDIINPFPLSGYHGPDYFCDRKEECQRLLSNIKNGINTTLLSVRRMGKTGLIHHTIHLLESSKKGYGLYLDIYPSQSLNEFINQLGTAMLRTFPEEQSIGKKFIQLIKGFRPVISFDPVNGQPRLSFEFTRPSQYEHSLAEIFSFLDTQHAPIVVAIDEFQQISRYPEKNTEALLRTQIQTLKNTRFIFSGSSKHMLLEMFNNSKKPFFASTQNLMLKAIAKESYLGFIEKKFMEHKLTINGEALDYIAEWSRLHTYYTQLLCNRLFASNIRNIKVPDVQKIFYNVLEEQEPVFFQYRNLLTYAQWNLLKAIAIEDKVYQPSSKKFIRQYNLGTPSHVQRALAALLDKEMIFNETDVSGTYYCVYDCLLARWLQYNFKRNFSQGN